MPRIVTAVVPIVMTQFVTNFGFASIPIFDIVLGVAEGEEESAIIVDITAAQQLFDKRIGIKWRQRTLAMKGATVPKLGPVLPILRVDFDPSIESIARFIFEDLSPEIERLNGGNLVFVIARGRYGSGIFVDDEFSFPFLLDQIE
ncbi:hypothetical protein [Chengkuizengella sediminis]|uniref:hypothetical protein n=1 Tax=Chengkuizengella sediminis TaxID=1885917 RepID=UPI001389DD99|nr:hypothetical protein [Chengkuizengella sediminis]NDI36080.1 hypothetical protein [Chengkuizengella sediminis]